MFAKRGLRILFLLISCCGGPARPAKPQPPRPPDTTVVASPKPVKPPPPPEPAKPCVANDECATRCDAGDAPSCTSLGKRYLDGENGLAEDKDQAKVRFDRSCAKLEPEGCYYLARDFGDDKSKIANYTIACNGGWAFACTNLGVRYENGKGVAADPVRARELAELACHSDSMGCANLGMYLIDGTGGPKDLARAQELSRRACDAGEGPACSRLAEMYDKGNGVAKDQVTARKIYVRACELGAGCNNLGVMYDRGEGGDVDVENAKAAFDKACAADSAVACLNRARFWRDGRDGTTDRAEAAKLFDTACKGGESAACDELPPVVAQIEKACKRKAADCTNWAWLKEYGIGVDTNVAAAVQLYEKACTAKEPVACENLGKFRRDGRGGLEEDRKRALQYFDRACKLGHDSACKDAADLRAAK